LFVEDSPVDQKFFSELFARSPIVQTKIDIAVSLKEAEQMLGGAAKYDGVLLDLNLPDSEGIGTVSAVVALCALHAEKHGMKKCPVIVLTAEDEHKRSIEAAEAGAVGFISKGTLAGQDVIIKVFETLDCGNDAARAIETIVEDSQIFDRRSMTAEIVKTGRELETLLRRELDEKSAWLMQVFNVVAMALLIVDEDQTVRLANPAAHTMFEYAAGELIGVSVHDLVADELSGSHPAKVSSWFDRPSFRPMGRLLKGKRKSGRTFPLTAQLSPITTARTVALAQLSYVMEPG
jgi:PAS domain S-box-containing protein